MRRTRTIVLLFLISGFWGQASALEMDRRCGSAHDTLGVGPYDYRDPKHRRIIKDIEHNHFSPRMEAVMLRGGSDREYRKVKHNVPPRHDLDYTLRAIPNHPRALRAVSRFNLKRGQSSDIRKTPRCYYQRALQFAPDDPAVPLLYAIHLYGQKKLDDAISVLEPLVDNGSNDPEVHYNLGLFYIKKKRYEPALERAHSAIALGYPMQGLARKLKRAGHWRKPEAAASP